MTKKEALNVAMTALNLVNTTEAAKAKEVVTKMIESLSVTRTLSDEAKAAQSEARKAKTAAARAELIAKVAPAIKAVLTTEPQTAKQIFSAAQKNLPENFTDKKVQYVLLHEMREGIKVIEKKGEPNYYTL